MFALQIDACDLMLSSLQDFTTSSHHHRIAHTHIRHMRSACNHHSKILQHHRIITGSHTRTHDACSMRSACNHHSKILQHHRIITTHTNTYTRRMRSTQTHTQTHDACDPFVIITPRVYNIIASSPDRTCTRTHTHIRRMRSVCNHHSKILQHHRIIIKLSFVIILQSCYQRS